MISPAVDLLAPDAPLVFLSREELRERHEAHLRSFSSPEDALRAIRLRDIACELQARDVAEAVTAGTHAIVRAMEAYPR